MRRVAVLQSNYIPWKGYFDIIHDVDEFVFYDDVQYTKNDWRNRNRIKTPAGERWLTIPVGKDERRRICDVQLPDSEWARQHWQVLVESYGAAPHFPTYSPYFEHLYLGRRWHSLSELNQAFIAGIAVDLLGMRVRFRQSTEFRLTATKGERLIQLLAQSGAEVYVSGPAARTYVSEADFARIGVEVRWKDYSGYPDYPQSYPPFSHHVTVLDVLFHLGPAAPDYIWGWRDAPLCCNSACVPKR